MGKFLNILAPEVIFKAEAKDYAGNIAVKELDYKRGKR